MAIDNRTKLARTTEEEIDLIEEKLTKDVANEDAYWTAIDELSRLVVTDPFNHLIYRNRGHRHLSISEFDLARADLTLSLKMYEEHWKTWHYLGLLNLYAGDYDKAVACYDKALEKILPDMPTVGCCIYWQYVALLHAGKKDSDKAKALLARVDKDDPVLHPGYKMQLLMFKGEVSVEEVQAWTDERKEQSPHYVSGNGYGIAMYHYQNGDLEAARAELRHVLDVSKGWYAVAYLACKQDLGRI